jgi:hypothetical protein
MSAVVNVRRAIHGKLRGDTNLSAMLGAPPAGFTKSTFDEISPGGGEFPYVIVSQSSSVPIYALGGLAMDNDLWLIKGVDKNISADRADAIADRLDALLTDGALSISGKTKLYLRRESAVRYSEVADGTKYVHSGHLFRLIYT